MTKKLNCIMLIDDNADDNFFHERTILKNEIANSVVVKQSARDALDYLIDANNNKPSGPELIFLDINMPGMNGWEFLEEYKGVRQQDYHQVIIVMLTTAENDVERARAMSYPFVAGFKTKPLTSPMLTEIIDKHF